MEPYIACPATDQLADLLLGRLSEEDSVQLEQHLLACATCLEETRRLVPRDTLLDDLRAAPPAHPEFASIEVSRVLARVRDLSRLQTHCTDIDATVVSGRNPAADLAELAAAFAPAESPDELGRLGDYRILEFLGAGGMGAIYRAEDTRLQRPVALKLLLPALKQQPQAANRFLREARSAAAVRHDHVVTIYQVGEANGVPFMAQELLHGETLEDRLKRDGRLGIAECLRIGREIAAGLAAAHARGLLHRDIKPSNVWLEAPAGRVKLLDFGLALPQQADVQLTQSGAVMGTPAYMSPEQAEGLPLDHRSDLFSLGGVLYRMTTGRFPFPGTSALAVLRSLAVDQPRPPRELNAEVPAALSNLIDALLSKDRNRRPADATAVLDRLTAIPAPAPVHAVAPPRRKLAVALALAAGAIVACAAIIIRITTRDGHTTEVRAPDTAKIEITHEDKASENTEKIVAKPQPPEQPAAAPDLSVRSPLDLLDPAAIPPEERFPEQPPELVAVLGSHRQRVEFWPLFAQLTADGGTALVIPVSGNEGRLLNTQTGELRDLPIPRPSFCCGLSPQGDKLLFTQPRRMLAVREADGWQERELPTPKGLAAKVIPNGVACFSQDGTWLAATLPVDAATDKSGYVACLWDVAVNPPRLVAELPGYMVPSLSPDRRRLAAVRAEDDSLHVFDVETLPPKLRCTLPGLQAEVVYNGGAFRPNFSFVGSGRLVTLDRTGRMTLWDVDAADANQARELFFRQDCGQILKAAAGAPGRVLTLGDPATIRTWRIEAAQFAPEFLATYAAPLEGDNCFDVALSGDGQSAVSVHMNGAVRVWQITEAGIREPRPLQPQPVLRYRGEPGAAFSPDGQYLAAHSEQELNVWRLDGPACRRLPVDFTAKDYSFAGWVNSRSFLFGGRLWTVDSDQARSQPFHDDWWTWRAAPTGVCLCQNSRREWSLWDFAEGRPERRLTQTWSTPAGRELSFYTPGTISADGTRCATLDTTAGAPETIRVWDVRDRTQPPQPVAEFEAPRDLYDLALSPDGTRLALCGSAVKLALYALGGGQTRRLWQKTVGCEGVAFSPDGRQVAAAVTTDERPGLCAVYATDSGEMQQQIDIPARAFGVVFAPDGRHLLTANRNRTAYILRLKTAE